jgi:hypothetical protein
LFYSKKIRHIFFYNYNITIMKLYLFSTFLLFFTCSLTAQVGIGTTSPNGSLDVVSTDDGLLIPRISLTATNVATVITPTVSELVYNTATSGVGINQVTPGYYYWDGALWIRLATGNATASWALTGNAGTTAATNFLGTTDDIDLVFRRNNIRAGFIGNPVYDVSFDFINGNTSFGANSLLNPTLNFATQSGVRNTAFGVNVMPGLTSGRLNTGIGEFALFSNTTGIANTAVGSGTLFSNSIGINNVAIGRQALTSSNADNNTAVGFSSLRNNASGTGNSAIGYRALNASTGSNNVALGFDAGLTLTTGSNNIMLGANTVAPVIAGSDQLNIGNTLFGTMAGALTSGVNTTRTLGVNVLAPQAALDIVSTNNGLLIPRVNLLFGANSSTPVTTISDSEIIYNTNTVGSGINAVTPGFYHWNTATARWVRFNTGAATGWLTTGNTVGATGTFMGTLDNFDVSFKRNNTAAGFIGASNVAYGLSTLSAPTLSGIRNTAFGTNALAANDSPNDNTAIGFNALAVNTFNSGGGNQNTAVGSGALATLNGGIGNTAVGFNALNASVATSQFNTAIGAGALSRTNVAASQDNVAIGYNSLSQTATFTRTVAIGSNALVNASGNNTRNTAIGAFAGSATTTGNDNIFIGNAAGSAEAGTSSNKLYIENTNADASNALVYGEFDTNILRVNGTLQVNNPGGANGYALPNVRGTVGQVLQTNGAGATSWVSAATVETDPQVSSATVNRMPKWNGTTLVDGIVTDNGQPIIFCEVMELATELGLIVMLNLM